MNPTTTNPNANFFNKGQGGNPSVINATAPSTPLDASKLATQTTVNLKPTTQVPVPDIASLMSSEVPQMVAPTAPQPKQGLGDKLAGLIGLSKGKEQDLQSQVSMQTQPYAQQLNELNTQIKMQQAKAISNQESAMQKGETTGFASREAQSIARTDAIETLKLSALAEGMRGNIALAEQQATQAINAKYANIDREIEDAKTNIYNNYDSLSPAEKKKADATLLRIDAQDAFVKTRKEDEKITQGFLQEAIAQSAQNGTPIPSLVLQRANAAEDPTSALQILAPYMVDAEAKKSALLDRQYKQAQINKMNQDIAESKLKGEEVAGGIDPATLVAYAQQYASTGTIPTGLPKGSFGVVSQFAKEAPKPVGTLVDRNTGVKSSSVSPTQEAGIIALKDAIDKTEEIKTLYNQSGMFNRTRYNTLKGEIVDALSRARSGAALTESEIAQYESKIPSKDFSINKFGNVKLDGLTSSLKGKLDTTLTTTGTSIYGYSKVKAGDAEYKVGDIITNSEGQKARINADGSVTLI